MPRNRDEAIEAMAPAVANNPEIKAFLDGLKAGQELRKESQQ